MITQSPEETRQLAREFMANLGVSPLPENSATIVELVGDLGAGKTTFMSGVGEFLGVKEPIISPTFLIQRNYKIEGNSPWKNLVHLDAYRIEDEKELVGIDWEKYSNNRENLIFIEWPENLRTSFPVTKRIEFKHLSEREREIQI
jgi:tRNA threonylcarbamoyladenosine biosynthesis protein TsaE